MLSDLLKADQQYKKGWSVRFTYQQSHGHLQHTAAIHVCKVP